MNIWSPTDWLGAAADAATSLRSSWSNLAGEIDRKVDLIPCELNEYGYDPWGYDPETFKRYLLPLAILYRHYFRCRTTGLERLPEGTVMLIGNHAGQVAFDGLMVTAAAVLEASPPRLVRGMGEYWLGTLPWMSILMDRVGSVVGTPQSCADMLHDGHCVMAFPEGVRGINKPYAEAYKLKRFGTGFMRLALETETPIVPVSIVGSEEQQPGIANLEGLGAMLGAPSLPITLTFPWMGPLGLLPLPVRYYMEFGEPIYFAGDAGEDDEAINTKVAEVKRTLARQLARGLAERDSIFL